MAMGRFWVTNPTQQAPGVRKKGTGSSESQLGYCKGKWFQTGRGLACIQGQSFLMLRVVKQWHRLPREVVDTPWRHQGQDGWGSEHLMELWVSL